MTTLEIMAKERFEEYVKSRKGAKAALQYDWRNLSRQRKLDWISEVYHTCKFVLDHWQGRIGNSVGRPEGTPTSYTLGFLKGVEKERIRNITILKDLESVLTEEYFDIIEGKVKL